MNLLRALFFLGCVSTATISLGQGSADVAHQPKQSDRLEQPDRPNVLMIVTDDCNTDLGCYGHSMVQTPNIDELCQRGTRFSRAYCQYSVCNPSRSSFMTGLYPDQTGVVSNQGNFRARLPNVVTLPQMFRNQGYYAARVGKIYHYGVPNQIGTAGEDDSASWDATVNPRGVDREVHDQIQTITPKRKHSFGGTLSWLNLPSESNDHTDGVGATAAIELMDQHHPDKTGRPFFLAVGFYRPHTPYVAPSKYFDMYPLDEIDPVLEKPGDRDDIPLAAQQDRPKQRELTLEQRKEIIQAYYASISLMDEQVGRVMSAVDRLGLAENTIVVFVSDHGYHLGAHGLWQKGDLFEGACRVPLVIAPPTGVSFERLGQDADKPEPKVCNSVVELVDLFPTLADAAFVVPPSHLVGHSLVPCLQSPDAAIRPAALTMSVSRARWMHKEFTKEKVVGYSVRTDRYRYTQWAEGEHGHELYDYHSDPDEYTNLADLPSAADAVETMRQHLKNARALARPLARPSSER